MELEATDFCQLFTEGEVKFQLKEEGINESNIAGKFQLPKSEELKNDGIFQHENIGVKLRFIPLVKFSIFRFVKGL